MTDLPDYYFRMRENGAFVFRVDTENRQRRIDMDQIAVVNIRNGQIKPQGERELSDADMTVIQEWMQNRIALLARRDMKGDKANSLEAFHGQQCRICLSIRGQAPPPFNFLMRVIKAKVFHQPGDGLHICKFDGANLKR